MPGPERRAEDESEKPNPAEPAAGAITDEEAYDEAESAREAKEEAEKLNAVPYEKFKKDEGR